MSFPENVPDAVLEFLPGEGLWMHSAAYDRHLTGSAYAGRFFLDAATDRLYFDTVNPTPQGTPSRSPSCAARRPPGCGPLPCSPR